MPHFIWSYGEKHNVRILLCVRLRQECQTLLLFYHIQYGVVVGRFEENMRFYIMVKEGSVCQCAA